MDGDLAGLRRTAATAVGALLAIGLVAGCAAPTGAPPDRVQYLGAATAVSPLEGGSATTELPATMTGANLLVAIAMGDGPDDPALQHSVLTDPCRHQWTLRDHHVVFGSIIDVYTAPGTGSEAGCAVRSDMTITRGDEGHALSVLAYRHGRFDSTSEKNGNFTLPQLHQDVPAGEDVLTAFVDGRQNTPITLVPGFRPVLVFPVDGGVGGDQDLYQLSRSDPPGSWAGGDMLTGNLAPVGSGYWGLVDVDIAPAD